MDFELKILQSENIVMFKRDMQDAFQKGVVEGLGETDETLDNDYFEGMFRFEKVM